MKTTIPENLEQRLGKLEEKADEKLPGDYTIKANFFTDGDLHLVAEHNISENYRILLHEGSDETKVTGHWTFGGLKVPAHLGSPWHHPKN